MNICEFCAKELAGMSDFVIIYGRPVCKDCAKRLGVQCLFCGEWGLKGDDDFLMNEPYHRKCLDRKVAIDKRKVVR